MSRRRIRYGALALPLAIAALAAPAADAQERSWTVVGSVADSLGAPLARVRISVDGAVAEAVSDASGTFRLGLPAGQWTIRARLIGYRPAAVQAYVRHHLPAADTVRLVLLRAAAELRAITVVADADAPITVTASAANVRQLPSLGEPDLLRVLPFLPGVQQPNDAQSSVYLAGAASDEVSMRLDGFELQWPTHLNGIFGAFNSGALDRADVLIHHLPPSIDGALGGVVDFWSRSPSAHATGEASLSLLSVAATTTVPASAAGLDILASGRATYAPVVLDHVLGRARTASADLAVPAFHDVLARVSRNFDGGLAVTGTAYSTADRQPKGPGSVGVPLGWAESLVGIRARVDRPAWNLDVHVATDAATADAREGQDPTRGIDVRHTITTTGVDLQRLMSRVRIAVGWQIDARRQSDHWSSAAARSAFSPVVPLRYDSTASLRVAALYADVSLASTAAWTASVGLRDAVVSSTHTIEPRILVGRVLGGGWRLDASLERRLQFDARLGPVGDGSVVEPAFLLRQPRGADMLALSTTWRPTGIRGDNPTQFQATVYARRFAHRPIIGAAASQDTIVRGFPQFDRVSGGAHGLALGGTSTLFRGVVVQASYTLQSAWNEIAGRRRAADWDIRHSLAAFSAIPLGRGIDVTIAGQMHSGFPITPVATRVLVPVAPGADVFRPRFAYADPNSARIGGFQRVDVGLRKTWRAFNATWSVTAQAVNVLARDNPIAYDWYVYFDEILSRGERRTSRPGLPFVPSLGVEVRW